MSNDIFEEPTSEPKVEDQEQPKVSVDDLVGEGKRFPTLDALVKKLDNADPYIKQLEEENRGLRENYQRNTNAEENLEELKSQLAELKKQIKEKSDEPSSNTTSELTTEKLEEIVSSVITKQEQSRTAKQNLDAVNNRMVEQFGGVDKAREVFNQKSKETGMSVSDLKALASKSPTAFYNIVGVDGKSPAPKGPNLQTSETNTAAMPSNPGQPKPGTREYYDAIRRERGNEAFFADVKLQQEIFQAKKNGTYDN